MVFKGGLLEPRPRLELQNRRLPGLEASLCLPGAQRSFGITWIYKCIHIYVCIYVNLYICIYVCMYICIHIHVSSPCRCTPTSTCRYMHRNMRTCLSIHMYTYVYIQISLYIYICICTCICISLCMYMQLIYGSFMYVYVYMHTYTYTYIYMWCTPKYLGFLPLPQLQLHAATSCFKNLISFRQIT